ncbi:TRAP transporter fused permease subunit [Nocardiopsis sp. HNM0947]|uniref:TRAP transporter fused permease subunit n=1 Tax=Nocardiopsis coralli TaxID=2772213 RepID=A0ABR9PC69_9ACTN|nr:TRAP transporter fused permease subunit [Nocardiopsis coralli]MBE3001428.1 TRAP transporter fused permease subunit [Nocardiopsis coralli]
MTTDSRPPDGPDRSGAGANTTEGALDDSTLKSIEEDISGLEKQDLAVDDAGMGSRQDLRAVWRWAVFFGAVLLAVFHLWTAMTQTLPPLQQRSLHLGLGLGLVFLLYPTKPRASGPKSGLYGAMMTVSFMLLAYLVVGVVSGDNMGLYLYLPQAVFGVLAVAAVAGTWWWIFKWQQGARGAPSKAQKSAGVTLLVLAALMSLDLVTSDANGGFFFLPILGLVLVVLSLLLAVVLLRYPGAVPAWLWPVVTRWGMTTVGFAILLYMAFSGVAGWHVIGPALLVLALVQAARYVPVAVMGLPFADILLAGLGVLAGMYMFFNYQEIQSTVGVVNPTYVTIGTVGILLVLVAASRVLGQALVVLASAMLVFSYFGQYMPGFLRHRGSSVDQIVTNLWVGTEGVFGTPLGISATFIFLFMIFAAMLQRTGMEKFFTDLALGATGSAIGGTSKVGIVTSAFTGTITGSSVAGTVSNGAFTIPMMKKSGYNREYAGAVEASSSTGGQILPPIMGAGAFIMIEFTGASYGEILVAAAIPAMMFFVAQYVVVHYDSKRFGIGGLPKEMLPSVRQVMLTRGYLLIPIIAIFALLSMGYSPMFSAMGAVAAVVAINLFVQVITIPWTRIDGNTRLRAGGEIAGRLTRLALPLVVAGVAASALVWAAQTFITGVDRGVTALIASALIALVAVIVVRLFRRWAAHDPDRLDLNSILDGLVGAARLAVPIIIACASAGIIAGVITTTDLGLKLSSGLLGVAGTISTGIAVALDWLAATPLLAWANLDAGFGAQLVSDMRLDLALILVMSMLACLVLGIGLPTTANYVITATLAAPAIVAVLAGEFDVPQVSMLLMAHMFVYYFGVLADITPPVCLAAYAASGISGGDAVKTGVYSVRIACAAFIMPFMFVFNPALLLQDVTLAEGVFSVVSGFVGAVFVALGMTGFIRRNLPWPYRTGILVAGLLVVSPGIPVTLVGLALGGALYGLELYRTRHLPDFVVNTEGMKPMGQNKNRITA